jgi:hypothetical protein
VGGGKTPSVWALAIFDAAASSRKLAVFMPEAAMDWAFILRTYC